MMNAATLQRIRHTALRFEKPVSKKIVIDYSSPNIAKQFHIGNLRSTLTGRYLDKIHRLAGCSVSSVNYIGDWGQQFSLMATYWPNMRPSDAFWKSASEVEKIKLLRDCYVVANRNAEADENFLEAVKTNMVRMESDIERNDVSSEVMQLWSDIREMSISHLKDFYTIFDIQFDEWRYESQNVVRAKQIADELKNRKLIRQSAEGFWAAYFELPSETDDSEERQERFSVLLSKENTTLYLTREIADIIARDEHYQADSYLYVVDKNQRVHFENLKQVLQLIGKEELAEKVVHVPFGRVHGLSTRKGKSESVDEIISAGTEAALDFMRQSYTIRVPEAEQLEIAKILSISTIVFNNQRRARNADYEFNFKSAFALNDNNALGFQMRHSRLTTLERKHAHLMPLVEQCQEMPEMTDEVKTLLKLMEQTEQSLTDSLTHLEPCKFTSNMVHINHAIGPLFSHLRIKDQPVEVAVPRLLLFSAIRSLLAEGMRILGMEPVEQM